MEFMEEPNAIENFL